MTFSLLGRCARTGQFGAVVTTSDIAVGARCVYARAGVGAVLTQHRTDPQLGPLAIELLARGISAQRTLDAAVATTPHHKWRQLAVIDRTGATAWFSGANVRGERSEAQGVDCVAIGNILRTPAVGQAMVAAFTADPAVPLATRLIQAVQAGEDAGGEFAALVSASVLVVDRESFPYVDLRVDMHATPLAELARLWAAYAPRVDDFVRRAVDPESAAGYVPPPAKAAG